MAETVEITFGFIALVAVLSIGGLLFVGWEAEVLGQATAYQACCTVENWRDHPTGIYQSPAVTSTELCDAAETTTTCCTRAAADRTGYPVKVLGAYAGSCTPPEISYPTQPVYGGYRVCCAAEMWQNAPVGYAQSTQSRYTQICADAETPVQCCVRSAFERSVRYPTRFMGVNMGSC